MARLVFIYICFIVCVTINGQQRSLEEAIIECSSFCKTKKQNTKGQFFNQSQIIKSLYPDDKENKVPFYFFTDTVTKNFVIISGDKRMKTILGYSSGSKNDTSNLPIALTDILHLYANQYNYIRSSSDEEFENEEIRYHSVAPIKPLLATTWGQGKPFNNFCPTGTPSGCVATAMAQIMNHHHYPTKGNGFFAYTSRTNRHKLSMNFSEMLLDWDSMCDNYQVSYNKENEDAVAKLMYACGVSVSMDYTSKGSGAYDCDVPYALINYFGYNRCVTDYMKAYYKEQEWKDLIYTELKAGNPILYCGVDSREGGHAFIVDGIDEEERVHINWGWDGNDNGYFELNALNPGKYNFSTQESMVVHISPEYEGHDEDVFYANKFAVNNNGIIMIGGSDKDEVYKCIVEKPFCLSNKTSITIESATFKGYIGIALYSAEQELITVLDSTNATNYQCANTINDVVFILDKSKIPSDNQEYYLAPIVKNSATGCITRIRTKGGITDFYPIRNNSSDDPDEETNSFVFSDDFEYDTFPSQWMQESEKGNTLWKLKKNSHVETSDKEPIAQNGYSYISLGKAEIFTFTPIQTRLYTNCDMSNGSKYSVSFYYRGHVVSEDNAKIELQVKKHSSRQWNNIATIPVLNSSEWQKAEILIENTDAISIGFLGAVQNNNLIFVDNIIVQKIDEPNNLKKHVVSNGSSATKVFTLQGIKIDYSVAETIPGIYIINGKKVLIKRK